MTKLAYYASTYEYRRFGPRWPSLSYVYRLIVARNGATRDNIVPLSNLIGFSCPPRFHFGNDNVISLSTRRVTGLSKEIRRYFSNSLRFVTR